MEKLVCLDCSIIGSVWSIRIGGILERRVVQVQEFWEIAENCMHCLAARGLPPSAISDEMDYALLRELLEMLALVKIQVRAILRV